MIIRNSVTPKFILPNATKYTTYLDKKYSKEQNKRRSLEIKCKIVRIEVDYSSSNLILWQAVKKLKLPFLCNFHVFSHCVVSLVNISLFPSLLVIFSSYFKILKHAPGHNHDNKIHQPGQCPFNFPVVSSIDTKYDTTKLHKENSTEQNRESSLNYRITGMEVSYSSSNFIS